MNDELKYCKFCDKTKPKKEFCKSGFAIKNICRECQNKKQKEKLNASKNWNELKKWLEECLNDLKQNDVYDRTSYETGQIIATECIMAKMQELEGNNG